MRPGKNVCGICFKKLGYTVYFYFSLPKFHVHDFYTDTSV